MPNQRKGAGRLRLLITALVVTSVSLVGAIGTASASPTSPATGTLEICKVASGPGVAGTFDFTIQGRPGTVRVPVGGCSFPITLPVGTATVTEVARPGFSVSAITSNRLGQSDVAARTARVSIVAGGIANQTIVTFTNRVTPKGILEVCKKKPAGDTLTGRFNFTVSQDGSPTRTVTVPVGGCSLPLQLFAGEATVTEVERTGAKLVSVATTPADRVVGTPDLATRTARVRIVAGGAATQTILTFTNKDDPPQPKTGLVKICKIAGPGVRNGTPFTFTLAAGTNSVVVEAGDCSAPQEVPLGHLTVTEKVTNGLQVSKIEVDPQDALVGQPDLTAGTVTVDVKPGRVATEVTFTNRAAPPGTLKVCKVAGNGVVNMTPFSFTVGTRQITVQSGSCSLPQTVPAGNLTITEAPTAGLQVTDITVAGAGALVSKDLAARKVTVNVASSLVTEAAFTNTRPGSSPSGCVRTRESFKNHPGEIARLVPNGGLLVGGDRLTAAQVHAILKRAGWSGNYRFKLQGQLITALLNQLAGASTPTAVQNAINAAQLLMSQGDGPLHKGAMNSLSLRKSHTLRFKGHSYKARELTETLASYNGGKAEGGPRSCAKDYQKGKKYKYNKKYRGGMIRNHPRAI